MRKTTKSQIDALWVRTPSARYPVWMGRGLLRQAGRRLSELRPDIWALFVVSSPRVWARWGRAFLSGLRAGGLFANVLLMNDAETAKRLATVERLSEELLRRGASRHSLIAALGGGVVGDVTGFLAATYMRGIDYIQVPTTVVAQVDSAIGGKTGVNLRHGKNLLGAFHHPLAVLADTRTLDTLPPREFRSGLYEVIKCHVLGNPAPFNLLERRMPAVRARRDPALSDALGYALRIKARLVAADEREHGIRAWLNFGHTFGHAFESLSRYRALRHGEAVGWGMIAATLLSRQLGLIGEAPAARIIRLIASVGPLPPLPRFTPERAYQQMFADKKKRDRSLRFVLPRRVGEVQIVDDIPRDAVLRVLRELPRGVSLR